MPSTRSSESFPRSERFVVQRRLGTDGLGVVYAAQDGRSATPVALKTLPHFNDAAALYQLKEEFRALSGVRHPNLVAHHDLVSEGDQWFFTMDLVEGTDFLTFVRQGHAVADAPAPPPGPDQVDYPRLRGAFLQLCEGLRALHAAGRLHRDLRPSHVIVTHEGRVVIRDFGLVLDLAQGGAAHGVNDGGATPEYMAPEQANGESALPAGDWYAVGVMLYQTLTGRLPFQGTAQEMLRRKKREEPARPSSIVASVPADLDALCARLLGKVPRERPLAAEVLRCFITASGGADPISAVSVDGAPFMGRETHLEVLRDAFKRAATKRRAIVVHVRGRSGMGKSLLVRRFLEAPSGDDAGRSGPAVVLEGRCYEREAVPYKAVDSLIDSLSRHLRLPASKAAELMPREIGALVRLFPVLNRVEAIARAPRHDVETQDAHELRKRGFAGLRELLERMANRRPLVLHIDDLQWGDADSAALLEELLRDPQSPAMLLVIGYRSEDAEHSELLRELAMPPEIALDEWSARVLVVGALERKDALDLARRLLRDEPGAAEQAELIVAEAGGSPFFLQELARAVRQRSGQPAGEIRLETVLANRLSRLPADARRLLEVVAVAGRPLLRDVASKASALSPERERAAVDVLRDENVLRTRGAGVDEELETFHDRIRETTLLLLDAKNLAGLHLEVANALEASGKAKPEALTRHFQQAGEPHKAAEYAILAGDSDALALTFDRAVEHFRYALENGEIDADGKHRLRVKLGDALRDAGRGADSAGVYTDAAEGAPEDESLDLRRRAAEQLLVSGRLDEGRVALRKVSAAAGILLFQRPWMALLSLLFWRLLIMAYGLRVRKRGADDASAATSERRRRERRRMDIYWTAATGLGMTDHLWGAEFSARYLMLALQAGDRFHLARALTVECAFAFATGRGGERQAWRAYRMARKLAEEKRDSHTTYLVGLCSGVMGIFEGMTGRWSECLVHCEEAQRLLGMCTGVSWELGTSRILMMSAYFHRGDFQKLFPMVRTLREDAEARGDRHASTFYCVTQSYVALLAEDHPDAAREDMIDTMSKWSRERFDLIHFFDMQARTRIDIYAGRPLEARQRLNDCWPKVKRAFLHLGQFYRVFVYSLRASAALAAAAKGGKDERLIQTLLKEADRDIRDLADENAAWAHALADSLRAPLALLRGNEPEALKRLELAAAAFDTCGMALYAAAARRRRGVLVGGGEGRALVETADAWMTTQHIKNPARMANLFAPGFADRDQA